jgi:uncharacterized membrane protein YfcA
MLTHQTMMELTGAMLGGAASGATGLAFPLIAGPFFLAVDGSARAVALLAMCALTSQFFGIALLRRVVAFRVSYWLIGGGVFGVPLGSALLIAADEHLVRLCFGGLIMAAALGSWRVPAAAVARPFSSLQEAVVGLCGGVTAGLVGASAVIPAVMCARRGWTKECQRALTQPYVLVMQALSLALLWHFGALGRTLLVSYLELLLPLLIGIGIGVAVFKALSTQLVTRAVIALATLSGLALLVGV